MKKDYTDNIVTDGNVNVYGVGRENITVMLNGQAMDFDVAPIIQNDRVLVPMRAIFEELHCSVDYTDIDGRQIITAKK